MVRERGWVVVGASMAVLLACGGGDEGGDGGAPGADTATTVAPPASSGEEVELVRSGEATPFDAADGRPVAIEVGADGSCTGDELTLDESEPFFVLCQHFEPFAIVTVSRDTDDHDTGILCADADGFSLVAVAIGTGTPVSTTLDVEGLGPVAVLTIHEGFVADATTAVGVVVAQPPGADCPVVHGLGPVAAGVGNVRSHTAVVEVEGADGGLLCTTVDGGELTTAAFPAGTARCPEPGG